jgi:hypothetical protein
MAQLDTTREALLALISRLEREHGQTVIANFALDEQLNRTEAVLVQLIAERDASREDAQGVRQQLKQAQDDNESLRCQIDPSRGDRFRRRKKAEDGAN